MRRAEEPTVDVKFCLVFPREALSVPVMRRVLGDTLRRLGADEDGIADLLLAVTEACTNVIRHGRGGQGRRYEVVASIGEGGCLVQVLNGRRRFESPVMPRARRPARRPLHYLGPRHRWAVRSGMLGKAGDRPPVEGQEVATLPESGRGLAIMRACVDDVTLSSGPGRPTVVSLQKRMELRTDIMLATPLAGQLRDAG
ncbi:MAG TPA: ATP-binding protein [Streptosporangiaceae bacterium]|nr:ATP-binding protein [Streptosporangiaceae bacterium]